MRNHRFKIIALVIGLIAGVISSALAAPATSTIKPGHQPFANVIQSAPLSPLKVGNVCVTKTIHNKSDTIAVFNLYTSKAWYGQAKWTVVKSSDGSAFVVERRLGNNTSGTPGSSGDITVNREYTTYALKPFGNNTSASLTACQDRQ